jgi:hypothetical protein
VVHPAPDQASGGVIEPSEAERKARQAREPKPEGGSRSSPAGRAAAGAAGAGLLFILGKAKFFGLLAGLVKFKTLATMLLSIGAYAVEWGWLFAAGFVLLIFVHEMGHAVAMRLEGIAAGAPVFIPFVGAFIAMQGRPRDAAVEARVAMAGPVAGSLAAWAVLWAGVELDQPLLRALGHTAVLINLFVQRWRHPEPGYEALTPRQRGLIAVAYAALILGLVATMSVGAAEGPAALAQ